MRGRGGQEQRGIYEGRVECDSKVQMRAGHATCCAYFPNDLARGDTLPCLHVDRTEVAVHGDQPFTMVDEDGVAVEEIIPGVDDAPCRWRFHESTCRSRDVHACVR